MTSGPPAVQLPAAVGTACGGLPGKPNPAYDQVLTVDAPAVGGFIGELVAGPVGAVIAAVVTSRQFDLLNICSQPQPAPVELTPLDYIQAFETTNWPVALPAQQKIIQWFLNAIWPMWCVCSDGTIPSPATPVPPPPVSSAPGLPSGPAEVACASGRGYDSSSTPGLNEFVTFYPKQSGPPNLPVGATAVRTTGSLRLGGNPDGNVSIDFQRSVNGNTQVYFTLNLGLLSKNPTFDYSMPVADNIDSTQFTIRPSNSTQSCFVTSTAQAYCGPANGIVTDQPCCPPDPYLDVRLQLMQSMLSSILTLVGQQGGHSSYVDGTRHSALSGFGSLQLVDAAAAVRVEVTTPPLNPQVLPGSPDFYWNMGFVTPSAMDTPLRGNRLVFLKQTFTIPPVTDGIDYTLLDGTIVDLVELLPGPLG